jgi:hypothetical protein
MFLLKAESLKHKAKKVKAERKKLQAKESLNLYAICYFLPALRFQL